jgi:hypothetical protein
VCSSDLEDGKRFVLGKEFNASLSRKATLYLFLVDWRGLDFTPEQLEGFDLDKILHKPATLRLSRKMNERTGKTYTEIDSIFRARKLSTPLQVETPETFIPSWVQRRIDSQIIPGYPRDLSDAAPSREEEFTDDVPF